jgi:hypothetical protein
MCGTVQLLMYWLGCCAASNMGLPPTGSVTLFEMLVCLLLLLLLGVQQACCELPDVICCCCCCWRTPM